MKQNHVVLIVSLQTANVKGTASDYPLMSTIPDIIAEKIKKETSNEALLENQEQNRI